jgi:pimeloyl-ACP methyl ester carboxylesterase
MTPNMVRANEVDFAYFEAGQGPLVLCLHGFPDTAWSFVPVLNRLAAGGYHAVTPFMLPVLAESAPAEALALHGVLPATRHP